MKSLPLICLFTFATSAFAQQAPTELRATGEHRVAGDETTEVAQQLALADAQRKVWQTAVTRLQSRSDVKALQFKPNQLEAYTAVLMDVKSDPAAATAGSRNVVQRVNVRAAFDASDVVKRMAALKKDQDATSELLTAWSQLQQIKDGRQFTARLLSAKASASAAATEPATVGGRTFSPAGLERARTLAKEALTLLPDSPYPHYVLGDLSIVVEEPEPAEVEYRKGLASQPDSSDGHRRLAEALRLQGEFDEADRELQETLRLDPKSARARHDLALVRQGQGRNEDAMTEFRESLKLDPDLIDAHNGLAIMLARQGRMPAAAAEFREMIRVDPDSASGYYNLATALADMDQDTEATAALREVIRINPNHYNAHYNLGEMFRLEGKYEDAAKQFREFLRLAPDNTPAAKRNIERAKRMVQQFEDPKTP